MPSAGLVVQEQVSSRPHMAVLGNGHQTYISAFVATEEIIRGHCHISPFVTLHALYI